MGTACNKTYKKQEVSLVQQQPQLPPNTQAFPSNPPLNNNENIINLSNKENPSNNYQNKNNEKSLNFSNKEKPIKPLNHEKFQMDEILNETPQTTSIQQQKHKEYWELKSLDEIYERLISSFLNTSLRQGQLLKVILEMIPFENEAFIKGLTLSILKKMIDDFFSLGLKEPQTLIQTLIFIKDEFSNLLKEYYDSQANSTEILQECKNHLELTVEFFQITYCFINHTIMNLSEKWWAPNKTDDFLEIYYIKFSEISEKIKEKFEFSHEKSYKSQEESPPKNTKSFLNVDIEQEFKKVGTLSIDIWDNCEVSEDLEEIALRLDSEEYIPKVKSKKHKKN